MDIGSVQSSDEIENINVQVDNHEEIQRTWDLNKIGNFDMDSWNEIFKYLSANDLANVAVVCTSFQTMAENTIAKRLEDGLSFIIDTSDNGWKPVVCRFKNVISNVLIYGPRDHTKIMLKDFNFIEEFLCESLTSLTIERVRGNHLQDMLFKKKFLKLEKLSFGLCILTSVSKSGMFFHLKKWCPNLKHISLLQCALRSSSSFLLQTLPLLESASFYNLTGMTAESLIIFMTLNRRLKHFSVNLAKLSNDDKFSCLPLMNELLLDLESLNFQCDSLLHLPNFRQSFFNLKKLSFYVKGEGTYTNEVNRIVKYLPQIEEIQIILCKQNLMTNNDLIDLLEQSSRTLTKLAFTSYEVKHAMKFGYDLHRNICNVTRNRSEIFIEIEFGPPMFAKSFIITKEWIKEDRNLIVLKEQTTC